MSEMGILKKDNLHRKGQSSITWVEGIIVITLMGWDTIYWSNCKSMREMGILKKDNLHRKGQSSITWVEGIIVITLNIIFLVFSWMTNLTRVNWFFFKAILISIVVMSIYAFTNLSHILECKKFSNEYRDFFNRVKEESLKDKLVLTFPSNQLWNKWT